MIVRVYTDIFNLKYTEFEVEDGLSADGIIDALRLNPEKIVICTPNGPQEDMSAPLNYPMVTAVEPPAGYTTMVVLAIIAAVAAVVVAGIAISIAMNASLASTPKVNSYASLRGSSNQARLNGKLPVILGRHLMYPDICAQPYTSYSGDDQYLHQMFCFGYKNVHVDTSTIKIGTTQISKYIEPSYELSNSGSPLSSFSVYPARAIETYLGIELEGGETHTRVTASSCVRVYIGINAPSGFYCINEEGNKRDVALGLRIRWREENSSSWTTFYDASENYNVDILRKPYEIAFPSSATYEVEVTRTTAKNMDSKYIDYAYWEMLVCFCSDQEGNTAPVKQPLNYSLLGVKIRASNQLNGTIDSLNAEAYLVTRYWNGTSWVAGATRNPASAVLYLLTDPQVNARPVDDSMIDWESFQEFAEYCDSNGFTCDACITDSYTIEDLCSHICQSSLASLVLKPALISIRIDKPVTAITQLFNPRNTASLKMDRSFESIPKIIKASFISEESGYTEVERTIRLNDDDTISFDTEIGEDEEAEELTMVGVTRPAHAARVMAVRLKQIHAQTRSYSFQTDIEGLLCLPGDICLLSTDSFLYGLGEARVTAVGIDRIFLDSEFYFEYGKAYGLKHRRSDGVIDSIAVVKHGEGTFSYIFMDDPSRFSAGDLVSFGYYTEETHTIQISSISIGSDKVCKIEAIDYVPEVFSTEMAIPEFDPGISKYPEGAVIGKGKQDPERASVLGVPAVSKGKIVSDRYTEEGKDRGDDEVGTIAGVYVNGANGALKAYKPEIRDPIFESYNPDGSILMAIRAGVPEADYSYAMENDLFLVTDFIDYSSGSVRYGSDMSELANYRTFTGAFPHVPEYRPSRDFVFCCGQVYTSLYYGGHATQCCLVNQKMTLRFAVSLTGYGGTLMIGKASDSSGLNLTTIASYDLSNSSYYQYLYVGFTEAVEFNPGEYIWVQATGYYTSDVHYGAWAVDIDLVSYVDYAGNPGRIPQLNDVYFAKFRAGIEVDGSYYNDSSSWEIDNYTFDFNELLWSTPKSLVDVSTVPLFYQRSHDVSTYDCACRSTNTPPYESFIQAFRDATIYTPLQDVCKITWKQVQYSVEKFWISGTDLVFYAGGVQYLVSLTSNWALTIDFYVGEGPGEVEVSRLVTDALRVYFPVGFIYMSVDPTSPALLFGGKWTQLYDTFLIGASKLPDEDGTTYTQTYVVNAKAATKIAGEATHQLTVNEMPNHKHVVPYGESYAIGIWGTYGSATRAGLNHEPDYDNYWEYSSDVGGNGYHNNMPPYLPVYIWRRDE